MGGWLGTLIGLEPDVRYCKCPGKGTNDDEAVALSLLCVFIAVCLTSCSFWLMTCFAGQVGFFHFIFFTDFQPA